MGGIRFPPSPAPGTRTVSTLRQKAEVKERPRRLSGALPSAYLFHWVLRGSSAGLTYSMPPGPTY
jgi:hypothetical protein